MTTYEITVNGKSYDVTVEKKKTALAPPTNLVSPTITLTPVSPVGSAGKQVVAPMPGKIMAIKINVGDHVQQGQEMLIMEAMKMHNPILAVKEGVITEILVQVNDPVQTGQILLSIQ